MNSIVRVKFGSHLYGTNSPQSDLDYKGVYLPCAKDILLQQVQGSVSSSKREKSEHEKNVPGEVDEESYSLQKYLQLLVQGQTVGIDMLFAPELIETTPLWEYIRENKDRFLTKKSVAFVGYCRTQANKYGIKGSRVSSIKRISEFFSEQVLLRGTTAKVEDLHSTLPLFFDDFTKVTVKETTSGRYETYFECCNKLVGYKNTIKEAAHIFTRIYERYGNRAQLAQSNEGIDWKALSHAVRVGEEAIELLETRHITFPLKNAKHIMDIKYGKLPYNKVAEEIEELLVKVELASAKSTLPEEVDLPFINSLICSEYAKVIKSSSL